MAGESVESVVKEVVAGTVCSVHWSIVPKVEGGYHRHIDLLHFHAAEQTRHKRVCTSFDTSAQQTYQGGTIAHKNVKLIQLLFCIAQVSTK